MSSCLNFNHCRFLKHEKNLRPNHSAKFNFMHFMDNISKDLDSCIHTQAPYVFKTNEHCFNNHLITFLIVLGAFGCNNRA